MKKKIRLDEYLLEKGIFPSRSQARAAILAGHVYVNSQKINKAGHQVGDDDDVKADERLKAYVSRGGTKLEGASKNLHVQFSGRVVLDAGASTGGFTDFALKNGAARVYAIDVGYGQFDWGLRNDERVTLFERTNVKDISPELIRDPIDIALIDLSFISLTKVIERISGVLKPDGEIVALVKPQFEAGKEQIGKGGVVKNRDIHIDVLEKVWGHLNHSGFEVLGVAPSPLRGPKGNIEFFLHAVRSGNYKPPDIDLIKEIVDQAHMAPDNGREINTVES